MTEERKVLIQLKDIVKSYRNGDQELQVLKGIDLTVYEGEFLAIMGPSGSGKSTLMNIIGLLDRPTSGDYSLNGTQVEDLKEKELAKVRNEEIGFVFQSFQLLSRQSALENVELPLTYAGVSKQERRQRATLALERVGLGERLHFKPTQLSGGQKQRVAIARAMVNNPSILLADEPTGALDSKSGAQIMSLFKKLNEEGVTIVMITHDRAIADQAQRKIEILDGEIVYHPERGGVDR